MPKKGDRPIVSETVRLEFQEWLDSLGGCERVGKIHDVHRSTLSKYVTGVEPLPMLWVRYMWMSKELATRKGAHMDFHDAEVGENEF